MSIRQEANTCPVIGITGGIGSGKTTVTSLIKEHFPTEFIHCDEISRQQTKKGNIAYAGIVGIFGTDILDADGEIDRRALAKCIFQNETLRCRLNEATHPYVLQEVMQRIALRKKENFKGLILIEAALPREANFGEICDSVWYIRASRKVREERLMKERGYSKEKIAAMMKSQPEETAFLQLSDVTIENNNASRESLLTQITAALQKVNFDFTVGR